MCTYRRRLVARRRTRDLGAEKTQTDPCRRISSGLFLHLSSKSCTDTHVQTRRVYMCLSTRMHLLSDVRMPLYVCRCICVHVCICLYLGLYVCLGVYGYGVSVS